MMITWYLSTAAERRTARRKIRSRSSRSFNHVCRLPDTADEAATSDDARQAMLGPVLDGVVLGQAVLFICIEQQDLHSKIGKYSREIGAGCRFRDSTFGGRDSDHVWHGVPLFRRGANGPVAYPFKGGYR
ncbi:hypothetical protein G6F22_016948 [Rhizopus arrhizus]|nr:hypothetical protein G6F22_016948 [Rhizopus arrhizus]